MISNFSQSSRAGSEKHREPEGSATEPADAYNQSLQPPEMIKRGIRSRIPRRGPNTNFQLNKELGEGRILSAGQRAQILKTNQTNQKAARARSAEAGSRRPRGEVEKYRVTSGILGYSYKKAVHNRIQSNKSFSSFHSQVSPSATKKVQNNLQKGLYQNRYSQEGSAEGRFSDQAAVRHLKTSDDDLMNEMPEMPVLSPSCEKITEADQEDCSLIADEKLKASPNSRNAGARKLAPGSKTQPEEADRRKKRKEVHSKTQAFPLREPGQLSQIYLHKPINFNQMNQQVQQLEPSLLMQSLSRLQPVVIPEKLGHNGNTVMMDTEPVATVSGAGIETRLSRPRSQTRPSTQWNFGRNQLRAKQLMAQRVSGLAPSEAAETRSSKSKLLLRVATASSKRGSRMTPSKQKTWLGSSCAPGGSYVGVLDVGRKAGQKEATVKKVLHKANQQQLVRNQQFLDEHTPNLYHRNQLRADKTGTFAARLPTDSGRIYKPNCPQNEKRNFLSKRNPAKKSAFEKTQYSSRQPSRVAQTGQTAFAMANGYYSSIPASSQQYQAGESELMQSSLAAKRAARSSQSDRLGPEQSVRPAHISMQQKRLSRIQQLQVYQGYTEEDNEHVDTGQDYTVSNGGMLEEPFSPEEIALENQNQKTEELSQALVGGGLFQSQEGPDDLYMESIKTTIKEHKANKTYNLDSRKLWGEAKTGGTLGIAKEKFIDEDNSSDQMTERNKATKQRIMSGTIEVPSSPNRPETIPTIERHPSKKRHGHQPSQVGSRGGVTEEARTQTFESTRPITGELQEFSFAEEGQTKGE